MVIVDSTIWIHYLRTPDTPISQELIKLLDNDEVAIIGPILAEILQGARNENGFLQLLNRLSALPYLEISKDTWVRAAQLSWKLKVQGRLTPLIDLLIAAVALEGNHQVFTLDEHFQRVPGLRLYEIKGQVV